MKIKKRIILVGGAGSGKDYARKILENIGFKYAIPYTTREPRIGEKEGIDYYFRNKQFFIKNIFDLFSITEFNNWLYGITQKQFYEECNLFILPPKEILNLSKKDRNESFVIYFDISKKIRIERLKKRKNYNDNIIRRINSDEKDFNNFKEYDYVIKNPNFTKEDLINIIKNIKINKNGKKELL